MAKKRFKDLSEKEILALAIQLEEEDGRVYGDFAEGLRETYPATAKMFEDMQAEENRHRQSLIDMYKQRFGDHIPLIRRQDVKGFVERRPEWLVRPLGISTVRKQAEIMELETERFYQKALGVVSDASTRKLSATWRRWSGNITPRPARSKKSRRRRANARQKTSRASVFSCCKSCSRDSRV